MFDRDKHSPSPAPAWSPEVKAGPLARLDCLRAFAVLLVLGAHLLGAVGLRGGTGLGSAAHVGVLLFFVHTSMVLFMAMDRLVGKEHRLYVPFYVRRLFRIYPLSLLTVAAMVAFHFPVNCWGSEYHPFPVTAIVSNVLLLQNITGHPSILAPLWSLPFEVQMYVVLPLLFLLNRQFRNNALLIWFGAFILATACDIFGFGELIRYVPCFCGGIVAYSLSRKRARLAFRKAAAVIALVLVGYVLVCHVVVAHRWSIDPLDALTCLVAGITVGLAREPSSRVLAPAARAVAKYSYGIYLSHVPIIWFFLHAGVSPARVIFMAAALLLAPVTLYYLVEDPMIRIGIRLSNGVRSPVAGGAHAA